MRLSIRFKLFAAISGLILFFVLLSWLLNSFFLEKYYLHIKKNTLLESYRQINSIYKGDPEEISLELEKLERTKGLYIIIADKNFEVKYIFNQGFREQGFGIIRNRRPGRNGLPDFIGQHEALIKSKVNEILSGKIIMETDKDIRLNTNFIRLVSMLGNGDFIFMGSSVTAIQESAGIANKFFAFTGIVTILAGSIIVLFLSARFTRPIMKLNKITKRMTVLDFNERYTGKNDDEIGQLGASINCLSEQLEKSISELKDANRKLLEDIEKERKIDEMRKEFISSVSHELKTPIALIQGYTEGLKVNLNSDEESKNYYCDIITDEAIKMNRLVKELLELSQIESGAIDLEKSDFIVSELVEFVLEKNLFISKDKDIKVEIEKNGDLTVNADFERSEQVLTNYINNAINHLDRYKLIKVRIEKTNGKARITVFNSGRHIPEVSIEKIWTSFYKVDKARTRAYGGTGLGLSIVRAIQDAHQNAYGAVNVEGGVEFWFDLDIV